MKRRPNRGWRGFLLLALWFCASGAHCARNPFVMAPPQAPEVLQPQSALTEITSAINNNVAAVQSLRSTQATLSVNAGPIPVSLEAFIALERPRRFRLRASKEVLMLGGTMADIGSNDDVFWFWTRMNQPPALYFCRHDQFHQSPARKVVPIEPSWMIDAFGLTTFSPDENVQGPFQHGEGRLTIHRQLFSPSGPLTNVTVVDGRSALVLEQHLFDQQGQLLASAKTSEHRRDRGTGAWLPRKIEIVSNTTGESVRLTIHMSQLEVNSLGPSDAALWQKPNLQDENVPDIDLGNPRLRSPPQALNHTPHRQLRPPTATERRRLHWRGLRRR